MEYYEEYLTRMETDGNTPELLEGLRQEAI